MRSLMFAGVLALLIGCGPAEQAAAPEAVDPNACADASTRLAGTGLCQSEAAALLTADPNVRTPELEGCTWSVNETMLPGDEALLYHAATCNGVTTELAYAGGARRAEISYLNSASFGADANGAIVLYLYGTDPDPQGALTAAIAALPAGERRTCEIRAAGIEGWPTDALVIAPTAAARARMPQNEPIAACGPEGINEGETNFWRVRQGFAAFYTLGQEQADFDAYNLQVIAKGADGVWVVKP